MPQVKLIQTEDGSHSLYVPDLNETYHSFHGAFQESMHVFIKSGLDFYRTKHQKNEIHIFEVGFGTGLNALLTLRETILNKNLCICYHSIEPFPLDEQIYSKLNYASMLKEAEYEKHFMNLHKIEWNKNFSFSGNFTIFKGKTTLQEFQAPLLYDIIYFDAFAPNKQNELWTLEIMEKIYGLLKPEGIMVTYCAQGQFKRNLKAAGFEVEVIKGPPGKKEMVRAIKV